MYQQKTLTTEVIRDLKKVASTYSPTLKRAVPSALAGLTSLFGMGRGGPCCYRHPKRLIRLSIDYRMIEAVECFKKVFSFGSILLLK